MLTGMQLWEEALNNLKKFYNELLLLAILLLALALRVHHLAFKSISIDEAIGAFYAKEAIHRVLIMTINDVHPPLFYLLHHFWIKMFGMSEVALRSISIVFALASIWTIYHLARTLFNRRVGLMAALLLATSPWHVWISQNGRSNSMLIFLILLSTYFFIRILQMPNRRWFIWYGIVTGLALLTHYFAFMIWAVQLTLLLSHPNLRRSVGHFWWYTQGYIFLGYFIWLPFMVSQFISKTRPMYKTITPSFITNLFQYLNPQAAITEHVWQMAGWLIAGLLLLYGMRRLRDQRLAPIAAGRDATGRGLKTGLLAGYSLVTLIMLYGAAHFTLTTTLPLLTQQLAQNAPAIFADSIKPYHVQQLATLQCAFIATAFLAGLAWIVFYKIDALFPAKALLAEKETPALSLSLFFILHLVLPVLLAGLVSLKSPYLLLRNLVIILPFYLLVISYAIAGPGQGRYLCLSIPLLFLSSLSLHNYEEWYKKDDWRSLAQVLQSQIRPGDVILLDHLFGQKPLYYYGLESQRPLRRKEVHDYFNKLSGDLWIVRSYKNDWCVVDSTDRYFVKTGEWSFAGSTNPDDLFPMEGSLKLYHYQHKLKIQAAPTKLVDMPTPSCQLLPAPMTPSLIAISRSSKHKPLFK
jgi:uncharacterized membrane protein